MVRSQLCLLIFEVHPRLCHWEIKSTWNVLKSTCNCNLQVDDIACTIHSKCTPKVHSMYFTCHVLLGTFHVLYMSCAFGYIPCTLHVMYFWVHSMYFTCHVHLGTSHVLYMSCTFRYIPCILHVMYIWVHPMYFTCNVLLQYIECIIVAIYLTSNVLFCYIDKEAMYFNWYILVPKMHCNLQHART
jgi:hypothetical protein